METNVSHKQLLNEFSGDSTSGLLSKRNKENAERRSIDKNTDSVPIMGLYGDTLVKKNEITEFKS